MASLGGGWLGVDSVRGRPQVRVESAYAFEYTHTCDDV